VVGVEWHHFQGGDPHSVKAVVAARGQGWFIEVISATSRRTAEGVPAFPVRSWFWTNGVGIQRGEPEYYFWCSAREVPVILAALTSERFQVSWAERRALLR
jgi:hypothetical protein